MANNPYLYPMKYLLFYIISLLSLTACIHEECRLRVAFALEEGRSVTRIQHFQTLDDGNRKKTWKINLP